MIQRHAGFISGSQLGSGGEGSVYELRDRSDLVMKLYHKSLEANKAAKIASMVMGRG